MNTTCLLFLTLLAAGFAQAQQNRWVNGRGGGSGKWEIGANWSLDIPPKSNHDVVIAAALSETVTIDASTAAQPGNMVVSSLYVGRPGNVFVGTDTLRLLNAGLTTPLTVLGPAVISQRGIVSITSSALKIQGGLAVDGGNVTLNSGSILDVKRNDLTEYDLAVDGSVFVNGGSLALTNGSFSTMDVGHLGRGSMNILAGELRVAGSSYFAVGGQTGSVGTLTIAGGTARIECQTFGVGREAGSTGSVVVAGGELVTTNIIVGHFGVGQMTISNGIWRASRSYPSYIFRGTLTLAGGTSVVSSSLLVGVSGTFADAKGSMFMTGGTLFTTNSYVEVRSFAGISNGVWRASDVSVSGNLADSTIGRMVFAGGITTISSNLFIGSCAPFSMSTGVVTVAGGELVVTNAVINATLHLDNGVFRLEAGTVIVDTIDLMSPCARFERTGGTLIYRTALLDPLRDDDGDGVSNSLERSHGTDPLDPVDKVRDTDGDGASDVDEILSGTDRFKSNSVFKIISILPQGTDVRLRWKTVGGKTNIIQAAERIAGSGSFEDLAILVLPGTGDRTNTFIEPEGAIKGPSRFYRVKVIP